MWDILFASFSVALTGALMPGPLLTFTIYKSLKQKRGYLAGIFIILGHALIEFLLIITLLAGANLFFKNFIFLTVIGIIGGSCLITYGSLTIKNVYKKQIKVDFEKIHDLACPSAMKAVYQSCNMLNQEEVIAKLDQIDGSYERAMWLFLNHEYLS